ncbi:DivIVA domain-containing protein [Arthrobacter sp. R4-81]
MGAVSYFLVFLAVALLGVTVFFGTGIGSKFRSRSAVSSLLEDGFDEPVASLPPVLLPAHPKPSDVDHIRFALGLRGYRMDQVDQVLDELRDQLAEKDAEIARLRAALGSVRSADSTGASGSPGSVGSSGSAMRTMQEEGS